MKTLASLVVLCVSLGFAAPDAKARELVDRTSASFRWGPSSGPVVGYAVYVSRNGAPFPSLPELATGASDREATVTGNFGDSVAIRVTGFDAQGRESPPSAPSQAVRFVRSAPGTPNDFDRNDPGSDVDSSAPPPSDAPDDASDQPPSAPPSSGVSPSELHVFRWDTRSHRLSIDGSPAAGSRSLPLIDASGEPWSVAALAHFFATAEPLLLLRNARSQVAVWDPASPLFDPQPIGSATDVWEVIATPDLDGDASADVVWRHQWRNTIVAWISEGDDFAILTLGTLEPDFVLAGSGDVTGDGVEDLVWRNSRTGDLRSWTFNGSSAIDRLDLAEPTDAWRLAAVSDIDADGTADLLWQHRWRGTVHAWFMQGGQKEAGLDLGTAANTWTVASIGHPDRRMSLNLVWHHETRGTLVRWRIQDGFLEDVVELSEGAGDTQPFPPSVTRSRASLPVLLRTSP